MGGRTGCSRAQVDSKFSEERPPLPDGRQACRRTLSPAAGAAHRAQHEREVGAAGDGVAEHARLDGLGQGAFRAQLLHVCVWGGGVGGGGGGGDWGGVAALEIEEELRGSGEDRRGEPGNRTVHAATPRGAAAQPARLARRPASRLLCWFALSAAAHLHNPPFLPPLLALAAAVQHTVSVGGHLGGGGGGGRGGGHPLGGGRGGGQQRGEEGRRGGAEEGRRGGGSSARGTPGRSGGRKGGKKALGSL
jgi:hypothetical protein